VGYIFQELAKLDIKRWGFLLRHSVVIKLSELEMLRQLAVEMRTDYQASSQPQFFEGKEIFLEGVEEHI